MATIGVLAISSCKKDSADDQGENAKLSVVNLSPEIPAAEVYFNNELQTTTPILFATSSGYLSVKTGNRTGDVKAAGTSLTLSSQRYLFKANRNYSLFIAGNVSDNTLKTVFVEDDLTLAATSEGRIRLFHGCVGAPNVDILLNGNVVISNVAYASLSDFTTVQAGTYTLTVRQSGTTTVLFSLPNVLIERGKIYTLYAKGKLNGTGAAAIGAGIQVNY